jgi:hypothetical protein
MTKRPAQWSSLLIPIFMIGSASAQIYRENGKLIPGTENIHLGPGVNLSGLNLESESSIGGGANLVGFDLTGADLSSAKLIGANLSGSNLTGANLSHADLGDVESTNVNFDGSDLSGADLEKSFFQSSDFSHTNLEGADLLAAIFINVGFIGADFRDVDLSWTSFVQARFANADLSGATNLGDWFISGSNYNQWTQFPDHFSVTGNPDVELTLLESPIGDFNADNRLNVHDVDALSDLIRLGTSRGFAPREMFDVSGDGVVDPADRQMWVQQIKKTWYGDANLDGQFNSADLVAVFTAGQYEDAIEDNSTWSTGDWQLDGDFDTSDLVTAFQDGGYEAERRPGAIAVPEPHSIQGVLLGLVTSLTRTRRRFWPKAIGHRRLGRCPCCITQVLPTISPTPAILVHPPRRGTTS